MAWASSSLLTSVGPVLIYRQNKGGNMKGSMLNQYHVGQEVLFTTTPGPKVNRPPDSIVIRPLRNP